VKVADALANLNEHPRLKEIIVPIELWPRYDHIDKKKSLAMNGLVERSCRRRDEISKR
jgi:hypothetical protein